MFDVFYKGETIDLIVPTRELAVESSWYSWFNSQQTTKYTDHGVFPNTVERQESFFDTLSNGTRFALLMRMKGRNAPSGVVSLSSIDFRKGSAALAIVTDTTATPSIPPFASLEAVAIVTKHGFDVMGLKRIESGQAYPALAKWNQMLEILGYRTEGFRRRAFSRGRLTSDVVMMACLLENFIKLDDSRQGAFWPGAAAVRGMIRALPKTSFAERINKSIEEIENDYFQD
jgi:hypothetical protein